MVAADSFLVQQNAKRLPQDSTPCHTVSGIQTHCLFLGIQHSGKLYMFAGCNLNPNYHVICFSRACLATAWSCHTCLSRCQARNLLITSRRTTRIYYGIFRTFFIYWPFFTCTQVLMRHVWQALVNLISIFDVLQYRHCTVM